MIEIKTLRDIENLKRNFSLDTRYVKYIEKYFNDLMEVFRENLSIEKFSLVPHGHIVLLEAHDILKTCLIDIGIDNLLDTPIEFVNRINLQDSIEEPLNIYHTFILYDNEYGLNLFSVVGTLSHDVEEYLSEYICE